MGRAFNLVIDNRILGFKIDPVLAIRNPARLFQQRPDAAFLDRVPVAIKCIARQARHLTRPRHVAEFFRQIEKADFMPDDSLSTL